VEAGADSQVAVVEAAASAASVEAALVVVVPEAAGKVYKFGLFKSI
jgi:hypothetical protein